MSKTLEILINFINNEDLGKLIFNFSFNINKPFETGYYEGILDIEKYDYYNICKYNYRSMLDYCINNLVIDFKTTIANEINLKNIKNIIEYEINSKLNDGLLGACESGNIKLAEFLINSGADDFLGGFYYACKSGNIKLIRYMQRLMYKNDADECEEGVHNDALSFACKSGNKETIDYIIKYYHNTYFNESLYQICKYNHIELIDHIMTYIENNKSYNDQTRCLNEGLIGACQGDHIALVELMIEKGANNFNEGLHIACKYGHIEIAKLMIHHGANDFNRGLKGACEGGHIALVELMIEKEANDFNKGLESACEGGHIALVELMIKHGANNFNKGLYCAKIRNRQNIIKLLENYI